MNTGSLQQNRCRGLASGLTLMELLVATAISSIVLAALGAFSIYGARTFAAIGNYSDLEAKSRNALDVTSRQLRLATALTAARSNLPVKSLTFSACAQDGSPITVELLWDADARTFELIADGERRTLLTECDSWDFAFYNRAPTLGSSKISFNAASTLADCKLIDMSWKCSRSLMGKTNAENVQTMQIVLRNKLD